MEKQFEEAYKHDLQIMDQRLTEMEEKITSIDTKLTQVVDALLGNPLTNKGGFNKEIEDLNKKLNDTTSEISKLNKKVGDLEDFKKRIYWIVSVLIFIFLTIQYFLNIYTTINRQ